jgi:S-DNA-T family DNA segregation ATPase FtsK/SpoIIIE
VDELHYRTEAMSGQSRKFTPSKNMPLNVVIIDELGYLLRLLPDRAQRQEAQELLTTVLVLGRAVGICLIGALQDPRKEVLDSRDLWPTKVALRLTREMTDLVLGRGAWEAGARCDQITPEYAGAAYVLDEATTTMPQLVRAWWFSDDDVKKLERDLRRYVRSGMA